MIHKISFLNFAMLASVLVTAKAAPFQNLDFEEANTNAVVFDESTGLFYGKSSDLLPGWTILRNGEPLDRIGFSISVVDGLPEFGINLKSPQIAALSNYFIPGELSVRVFDDPSVTYTMLQTGDVPVWAEGLAFNGYTLPQSFQIRLNDMRLDMPYPGGPGFDIRRFAGQAVDLNLTFHTDHYGMLLVGVDSLAFLIPEPTSLQLFVSAGIVFGTALFFRTRQLSPKKRRAS